MKTRKTWAAHLLAAAAAAGVMLSLAAAPAQAVTTLKIGTVVWIGYGPFFVADALDRQRAQALEACALAVPSGS